MVVDDVRGGRRKGIDGGGVGFEIEGDDFGDFGSGSGRVARGRWAWFGGCGGPVVVMVASGLMVEGPWRHGGGMVGEEKGDG